MTDSSKHPNAATDPDCTTVQALEEALQSRIAAELHHKTVAFLESLKQSDRLIHYPVQHLLDHIEQWRSEIELKYTRLRQMIGLTGGTKDAT